MEGANGIKTLARYALVMCVWHFCKKMECHYFSSLDKSASSGLKMIVQTALVAKIFAGIVRKPLVWILQLFASLELCPLRCEFGLFKPMGCFECKWQRGSFRDMASTAGQLGNCLHRSMRTIATIQQETEDSGDVNCFSTSNSGKLVEGIMASGDR
uniref:Uncharacterized protein n=1 Tax=Ditylenchus dipsaci TaxID=166011 RepID=A0A915D1A6_9BILA